MKKMVGFLTAGALVCSLAVPGFAQNVTNAELRSDFTIEIDGDQYFFTRADGSVALPILYKDTTYLPLRSIGQVMGKNVNWDESNKTITLSGSREELTEKGESARAESKDVMVQEKPDFTIVIDGDQKEFKTPSGDKVNPIVYNGSTYLPLRAIGQIMGKNVAWDSAEKKVSLAPANSTVTDADSFVTEGEEGTNLEKGDIGMGKAKEIALAHAKLDAKDVRFVDTKMDKEDGKKVYEIEFYHGNNEYDYEIDALTGAILSVDHEIEDFNVAEEGKFINAEQAKKAALGHANVKNSEATFTKVENDDDKNIEVAFYTSSAEYEYTIHSITGAVIDFEMEDKEGNTVEVTITLAEAKKTALSHAGVKEKDVTFTKAKLDTDDKNKIYELEFQTDSTEFEYTIDAKTGKVVEFEKDEKDSKESDKGKKEDKNKGQNEKDDDDED